MPLLFARLAQFHVDFVLLLLSKRQFLVDVSLEGVVGDLDLVLPLLKLLPLVDVYVLCVTFIKQLPLFLFNLE